MTTTNNAKTTNGVENPANSDPKATNGNNEKLKFACTACASRINSTYCAYLHPLLGTLICQECLDLYGSGDFSVHEDGIDDQGDDNLCRWCCDGGELIGCHNTERCHHVFCQECIKRNCPNDEVLTIIDLSDEDKMKIKWICYACDKSKLAPLRQAAQKAIRDLVTKEKTEKTREDPPITAANDERKETQRFEQKTLVEHNRKEDRREDLNEERKEERIDQRKNTTKELMDSDERDNRAPMKDTRRDQVRPERRESRRADRSEPPTTVPLGPREFRRRMENHQRVKQYCMREVDQQFDKIFSALLSTTIKNKRLFIDTAIEQIRKPMREFEDMLSDIKRLPL